jgi:hypothetical protein
MNVFDIMQIPNGCCQIFSARGCSAPTCTPLATNRPVAPMLRATNPLKHSVYCVYHLPTFCPTRRLIRFSQIPNYISNTITRLVVTETEPCVYGGRG